MKASWTTALSPPSAAMAAPPVPSTWNPVSIFPVKFMRRSGIKSKDAACVRSQMAPRAVARPTGCSGSPQRARASSATCQSRTLAAAQTWRRSGTFPPPPPPPGRVLTQPQHRCDPSFSEPPAGKRPFQHFRVPHRRVRADEVQPAAPGGGGGGGGRQRQRDPAAQAEDPPEEAADPTQPHAAVRPVPAQ